MHLVDLKKAAAEDLRNDELFASASYRQQWIARRCQDVHEIADACLTAQHTLNDLLTYDKIESGMFKVEKVSLSVIPFIQKELNAYAIQARCKDIQMVFNWKDQPMHNSYEYMTVFADRHKLSQVFRNLVSNALKFTPMNGQINIRIRILCQADECSSFIGSKFADGDRSITEQSARKDITNQTPTSSNRGENNLTPAHKSKKSRQYVDITSMNYYDALLHSDADLVCRIEVQDTGPGIAKVN